MTSGQNVLTPVYASYHLGCWKALTIWVRALSREVHAVHQSLKARLGAPGIQDGSPLQKEVRLVMLFIPPLDPRERFVLIAKAEISCREQRGCDIAMSSDFV